MKALMHEIALLSKKLTKTVDEDERFQIESDILDLQEQLDAELEDDYLNGHER